MLRSKTLTDVLNAALVRPNSAPSVNLRSSLLRGDNVLAAERALLNELYQRAN